MTIAELRTYINANFNANGAGLIDGPKLRDGLLEFCDRIEAQAAWKPVFTIVIRGSELVMKIVDWTGGQGVKPPVNVFLGSTNYTADINSAVNIRGSQGPQGVPGSGMSAADLRTGIQTAAPNANPLATQTIGNNGAFQVLGINGGPAFMQFQRTGSEIVLFGLDNDNVMRFRLNSVPNVSYTLYHSGSLNGNTNLALRALTLARFIRATTSIPTATAGTGLGSGGSAFLSSDATDMAGALGMNSSGATPANSTLATVAFTAAYDRAPKVILQPASDAAATNYSRIKVSSTTAGFTVSSGSVAIDQGVYLELNFLVIA